MKKILRETKMKTGKLIVLTLFIVSCTGISRGKTNLVDSNPFLAGVWSGEGRFYDVDFNREVGIVKFKVEINKDNTVSGKMGDAWLTETSIERAKNGFEIRGVLDSPVKKNIKPGKDHLIILLVNLVKNGRGELLSDASFHLKSNYYWDFTMHVGGVILEKNE